MVTLSQHADRFIEILESIVKVEIFIWLHISLINIDSVIYLIQSICPAYLMSSWEELFQ